MTRKNYREVAEILSVELSSSQTDAERAKVARIARDLADSFKRDNIRFDRDRFYTAVGI